ncbi:hypothetical protein PspLS_07673 [Pyricularia sp. CBS 133598]|nr:hypothetical protein PspLS_07673 [Pyricularia sp. CBS 133598]
MLSLRQGTAVLARQSRTALRARQTRSYASDHTHHTGPASVEEGMGTFFYVLFGAVPVSTGLYYATRPGPNGEPSTITTAIDRWSDLQNTWEERNSRHTDLIEQAAHDKNLFYNTERNTHVELKYPEVFQQGSPYSVPAGHYVNLDKVVDHYRQKHVNEEEAKASKLAAKKAE